MNFIEFLSEKRGHMKKLNYVSAAIIPHLVFHTYAGIVCTCYVPPTHPFMERGGL